MATWEPGEHDTTFATSDDLFAALLDRGTEDYLYRGHRLYEWQLVPTLSRALRAQGKAGGPFEFDAIESMVVDEGFNLHIERVETELLRTFMDKAQSFGITNLPSIADRLAWWEIMQHHGSPTRLLDWTRSPFVALWFAVEKQQPGEDAALWLFNCLNSWWNHRETMTSVLTSGPGEFLDVRAWQNRLAEHAIKQKMIVPLIVTPRVELPRAVAQQSVLTLIPNVEAPQGFGHLVSASFASRVRLPASWRSDIVRVCEGLGITRLSLYRDLDTLGSTLALALSNNQPISIDDKLRREWLKKSRGKSGV